MSKTGRTILTLSANAISAYSGPTGKGGGEKGRRVTTMTRGARSRMLALLNSLSFRSVRFVTLTYHYNQVDGSVGYAHLRSWHKAMARRYGACGVVWRAERQERGAIHYHVFCVDAPGGWNLDGMRDEWLRVTAQIGDVAARLYGVHEVCVSDLGAEDVGVMVSYMTKYASKDGGDVGGKQWGVLARAMLVERKETKSVSRETFDAIVRAIERMGVAKSTTDGGGTAIRYYLGCVGGGVTDAVFARNDLVENIEQTVIELLLSRSV